MSRALDRAILKYEKMPQVNGAPIVSPGFIFGFPTDTIPGGYLRADGSAVSRIDYADLFEAIGELYGSGDGETTFNLPDLRGEFLRGSDGGRGVDSGRSTGSFQNHAYQNHSHGYQNTRNITIGVFTTPGGTGMDAATTDNRTSGGGNNNTAGETRPRNVAVVFAIKI